MDSTRKCVCVWEKNSNRATKSCKSYKASIVSKANTWLRQRKHAQHVLVHVKVKVYSTYMWLVAVAAIVVDVKQESLSPHIQTHESTYRFDRCNFIR